MTHQEYRDACKEIGMTFTMAAFVLGVNERTSGRWANGERTIPEIAARFINLMKEAKITPERAVKLLGL